VTVKGVSGTTQAA